MLYNANRGPDTNPADPSEFNPYAESRRRDNVICYTDDFSFMKPRRK